MSHRPRTVAVRASTAFGPGGQAYLADDGQQSGDGEQDRHAGLRIARARVGLVDAMRDRGEHDARNAG